MPNEWRCRRIPVLMCTCLVLPAPDLTVCLTFCRQMVSFQSTKTSVQRIWSNVLGLSLKSSCTVDWSATDCRASRFYVSVPYTNYCFEHERSRLVPVKSSCFQSIFQTDRLAYLLCATLPVGPNPCTLSEQPRGVLLKILDTPTSSPMFFYVLHKI